MKMHKAFSQFEIATILAAHMGGKLDSWTFNDDDDYYVTAEVGEPANERPESRKGHVGPRSMPTRAAELIKTGASYDEARATIDRERKRGKVQRKRTERMERANRLGNHLGVFDYKAVPLGRTATTMERLERLEAAVLLMASHDESGPIQSITQFLKLKVSDTCSNTLARVPF